MPQPVNLMPTQAMQLPGALNRCYLGLSWQSFPGRRELDLDASAALFSRGQCVNIVSFQNLRDTLTGPNPPFTTVHTGDVLAGGGGGNPKLKSSASPTRDLERIYFDLINLPPQIDCICLVVNCFSAGANFAELQRATCRIVNADSDQELGRFELTRLRGNGLVFGQLTRIAPAARQFMYTALGMSRPGNTAEDIVAGLAGSPQHAGIRHNQVAPAPHASVAQKPTGVRCSPGMVAATAAGAAAGAAIFTAVALDTGMLGGEGGGIIAGAMADIGDISMPEMPVDVDLAPVGEALSGLGDMAGDAVNDAGEAVGNLASRLSDGEIGDSVGEWAGGAAEGMGDLAAGAAEWGGSAAGAVGEYGSSAYEAVSNVDAEGRPFFSRVAWSRSNATRAMLFSAYSRGSWAKEKCACA